MEKCNKKGDDLHCKSQSQTDGKRGVPKEICIKEGIRDAKNGKWEISLSEILQLTVAYYIRVVPAVNIIGGQQKQLSSYILCQLVLELYCQH